MSTLNVFSNRHIKDQVVNIKKGDWVYLENNLSKNRWSLYFNYNKINEKKLKLTYITQDEFFALNTENGMNKKFDVIVGNPPYQDGDTLGGGQTKIYNMFCKKAIDLLTEKGSISFTTPVTVCKKSKRFSLIGLEGFKSVDFTANNYFDVGVKICSWVFDKSYKAGPVEVKYENKSQKIEFGKQIFDLDVVDEEFTNLYSNLKEKTEAVNDRMFFNNNFGTSVSKEKINDFIHPLYKKDNDGNPYVIAYTKREPHLSNKRKFLISITQSLREDTVFEDTLDYIHNYVFIEISSKKQIDNIKSFIFTEYFQEHSKKWKTVEGSGFNYALTSLPKFDINKSWTNNEVEEFFDEFRNI